MVKIYKEGNDKGVNTSKRYNNCKYLCAQHWCTQTHKSKFNTAKRRHKQQYKNSGDFNTSLTTMNRSSRQRINKETADLSNTVDQMDLTDI